MAKVGRPHRYNNPQSQARRKWLLSIGLTHRVIKRNQLDRPMSMEAFYALLNQVRKQWTALS